MCVNERYIKYIIQEMRGEVQDGAQAENEMFHVKQSDGGYYSTDLLFLTMRRNGLRQGYKRV